VSSLEWVSLEIGTLEQMIISRQHHSFVMIKTMSGELLFLLLLGVAYIRF
jgi:hypothetical protein